MIRLFAWRRLSPGIALLAASLAACTATAHPASDPMAPFFQSLNRKDFGGSCCGASDCRPVRTQSPKDSPNGHWRAFVDAASFPGAAHVPNDWVTIPDWMVDDTETTLRHPWQGVLCWYDAGTMFHTGGEMMPGGGHVLCFHTPDVGI